MTSSQATMPSAAFRQGVSPSQWFLPNLLDRYIFKQLLDYFMLGVVVFSLVAFFSDTLFDFINDVQKYGISPATLLTIIGLQLPRSVSLVIPASCFLAVLIVYNVLNNNFELIAVRMNGISLTRLMRPAILLGVLSTIGTYLINDYVVPYCNYQTEQLKQAAIDSGNLPFGQQSFLFKAYDDNHNLNQLIYVGGFKGSKLGDSTILDMTHRKADKLKTMKIVQAKSGTYNPQEGWLFEHANIYLVSTNANNSSAGHSDTFHVEQLISNKEDRKEQKEREEDREAGVLTDANTQNFFELAGNIQRKEALAQTNPGIHPPSRKSYLALWEKITLPLTSLAIIFSAVALAIHHPRQGSQRGFLTALIVLFLYYVLRSISIAMGRSDWFESTGLISKGAVLFLAAWSPLIVVAAFGLALIAKKNRTL
ncbi:MAG: LptF/LptG family permease [Vampirovibrionales bacterium]|nr:LptF/LptG family permease [Vampirovibrionales bacterium]